MFSQGVQLMTRLCLIYDIMMVEGYQRQFLGSILSDAAGSGNDGPDLRTSEPEKCHCCPHKSGTFY